jgi:serine phosphatase RsbU (regulator of sigma subunit)
MICLKRAILFLMCLFIFRSVLAQTGAPLLSHFNEGREPEDQNWSICQDDNDVMLFANRRGILAYDGQERSFIRIPTIPYVISYNKHEKRVYVGGENNYGYLLRDEKGFYKYYSLSGDSSNIGLITKLVFTDSTVYFYGEQSISRHNIKTGKLELRLKQKENHPFTGMFITPKNTFINVMSKGLYRLEADTLFPIVTGYMTENQEILFSLPYNDKMVLLGINPGSLSLFDGIKYYEYQVKDNGYLKQSVLSEGLNISDSLYAFSTLDGGVMVVEKKSGKPRYTINYENGLPDDEVLALGSDNSNGLWISHQYGLTRAEMFLPVANFSIYQGLKGNLINSLWHNNELYVATSEGVFYLTRVENYSEYEVLIKKEQTDTRPAELQEIQSLPVQIQSQELPKAKKSILSRIFGKKTTAAAKEVKPLQVNNEKIAVQPVVTMPAAPVYERKKVSRLVSVNYMYKKVEGLNEKCKQMVSTVNGILVSTNKGLFNISNHTAQSIVKDRYIYFISSSQGNGKYYIATSDGYLYVVSENGKWVTGFPDKSFQQPLYSIVETSENTLWAGSDNAAYLITLRRDNTAPGYRSYSIKNDFPQRYIVDFVNDTIFLFTDSEVSYFDKDLDTMRLYRSELRSNGKGISFVISQPEKPWIKKGDDWLYLNSSGRVPNSDKAILKIFDEIISINTDRDNIWVIDGKNRLFRVTRNSLSPLKPDLDLFIRSIKNEQGENFDLTDITFGRGDNIVTFDLVAPWYIKQNSAQYQYTVKNWSDEWSQWSSNSTITLYMVPPGTYTLLVRAKDIWGNISEPKSLKFTIKAPFIQTTIFYILASVLALLVIILIVRFRERQLQKENRILEEKVKERTSEIEAQKQEITSSIEYASRIQMAMLPIDEHFKSYFSDYFVFFKPRDIVSGDFYWTGEDENHIFFTVADCTGHGVPGAFMSTLGISTLNEIITNKKDLHANTVLNLLRERIITSLHQTGKEGEAADGMDISFCILHKSRKSLEFSAAYNPLFIVQNGEIKEYKGDRMPIGIYVGEKKSFTNFEINVNRGDIIYIFSDGYSDQFGGPDCTKYKKSNLRKLLSDIHIKPMAEQKKIIESEFAKWRGKTEQIDDITIIGLKL